MIPAPSDVGICTFRYKYVLFDIDGTLADLSHRTPLVRTKPKNWPEFFRRIPQDKMIWPVFAVLQAMSYTGYEVILVSGRGEESRKDTEEWLRKHNVPYSELLMRPEKDYRGDEIVKLELLNRKFSEDERKFIVGVFDDRPKVIRMWQSIGLKVFNVGTGEEF